MNPLLTSSGVMEKVQMALASVESEVEGNWDGGTSQSSLAILNDAANAVLERMDVYHLEKSIRVGKARLEEVSRRLAEDQELLSKLAKR